jgi:GntR family transcriptional repressor for pyruvate dehydrogenase complex
MRLLIAEIVSGALATGDRLPREADLADQHQVSRGVAREVIRGLEERGLISVKHGIGQTVTPREQWDIFDPEILTALLQSDAGAHVLGEYLECRRILEVEAAGLAAERAVRRELDALRAAYDEMVDAAQRARLNPAAEAAYHDSDVAFHRAIALATENRALAQMMEPLHRALAATLRRSAQPEIRLELGLPEHERILNAILERDPARARQAMADHLATVATALQADAKRSRRNRRGRRSPPAAIGS